MADETTQSQQGDTKKTAEPRRVRPTVFVGLGGTGMEILLRLRRRIFQNDWNGNRLADLSQFPVASFLYFDLDSRPPVERSKSPDALTNLITFKEQELFVKGLNVDMYMNEVDRYPAIKAWLPHGNLSSIDTSKGAGQVRALSRLQFFDKFVTFRNLVKQHGNKVLNLVSHTEDLERLGLDPERAALRVVVVGSVAGGTGSGCFLDTGFMIKSLDDPKPAEVDAVLVLPGGYKGYGEQRINANAYAALMELEHAMRPDSKPRYVEDWGNSSIKASARTPFDDVFLVDTKNVLGEQTGDVNHIYDMVADVLFEDFGSSQFGYDKRSNAVNQQKCKLPPYIAQIGKQSQAYRMAYSSFGQVTIDTKRQVLLDTVVAESCQLMLKIFFNVAMGDKSRLPTIQERDEFLETYFHLASTSFEETLAGVDDKEPINEFHLVDELLNLQQGGSVVADLAASIESQFEQKVAASNDIPNWSKLVIEILGQAHKDVNGDIDTSGQAGPQGKHVIAAADRLLKQVCGGLNSTVRLALFRYLDNRERGGLDFAINLVTNAKERMISDIEVLREAAARYQNRAEFVRDSFNLSLEHLREAGQDRFLVGPDRAAATQYLNHLRVETVCYATMLLRQRACAEAVRFLENASRHLGEKCGVADDGETTLWDGLVGELVDGRLAVKATLDTLNKDLSVLNDAAKKASDGMYILLPGIDEESRQILTPSEKEVEQWAIEVFQNYGGSEVLFPKLKADKERDDLLGNLRNVAKAQLKPRTEQLRSIYDILSEMDKGQRKSIFEKAMCRAMPWVNASFDRIKNDPAISVEERFVLHVAVEDAERFKKSAIGKEMIEAIPSARLGIGQRSFSSTGMRDKIIIYCELSGIPIDSLVAMHSDWRSHYLAEKSNGRLPIHNHKYAGRFCNPIVPSMSDIEATRQVFGLFLKGVALGILIRTNDTADSPYQILVDEDPWLLGSERDIRADGFRQSHGDEVVSQVSRREQSLSPVQLLALGELLDWNSRYAYTARIQNINDTQSEILRGLGNIAASELADACRRRVKNSSGSPTSAEQERIRTVLQQNILEWTREIPGSIEDVDPTEVRRDEAPPKGAGNKRTIVPEAFETEALNRLVAATTPAAAKPAVPAAAPVAGRVVSERKWAVQVDGKKTGPFTTAQMEAAIFSDEVKPATKVWWPGQPGWVEAGSVPELAPLFPPPLDDDQSFLDGAPPV